MQLPFFNKRSRSGAIDVTAKDAAAADPGVRSVAQVLPDLGDYTRQFDEPLPSQMRRLPTLTFAILLGFAGWAALDYQQSIKNTEAKRSVDGNYQRAAARAKQLKTEAEGLQDKKGDLVVLSKWVSLRRPLRNVAASIVLAAAKNVQIRNLELRRRDPNVLKYSIQMTCAGTRTGFDAMRADLQERLKKDGWLMSESPPDPDDTRLIFDATITPAAN